MTKYFLAMLLSVFAGSAQAQTAPSEAEIASYRGLHRAAHTGDLAEIARLVAAGVDLNARDRRGRTPAHVAAYASRGDAFLRCPRQGQT